MANLRGIKRNLNRGFKAAEVEASNRVVNAVKVMTTHLAYKTPVDTSQALSNWTVRLNDRSMVFVPPHVPGQSGSTLGASAAIVVKAANIVLRKKRKGVGVYLTNAAPYIGDLERGKSLQNSDFVLRATELGRAELRKKAKNG